MRGSPAPTTITALARASPSSPSLTTSTVDVAGRASLPFVDANVSAYRDDNPASPHHDVLVSAASDASKSVFGVPTLRENQEQSCPFLIDPTKPRVLLNVDRTGGSKTHVTRVVGVLLNGVIIFMTPLLTLSADQMAKFTVGDERYGTVFE